MAKASFPESERRLLLHEGGYSNHPADPGGPTNFGITLADYRKYVNANATAAHVRRMQLAEAIAIYRAKYWNAMRCDELPAGVDYAMFDYGVNSGIGRAGKVLRRALGLPDNTSSVSDAVLAALKQRDPTAIAAFICDERLRFLQSLRTWPVFGGGWGRRVGEVKAFSLQLAKLPVAEAATAAPASVQATTGKAEVPKPAAIEKVLKGGSASGVTGVIAKAWELVLEHPAETAIAVLAVLVLVGIGVNALRYWHRRRQEAPMPGFTPVPLLAAA
jgi:lysozyme family protein